MKKKLDYEKFLILLYLKENLIRLKYKFKNSGKLSFENKEILEKQKNIVLEISEDIFGIYEDHENKIDKLIKNTWPYIKDNLLNGSFSYEWTLKDFSFDINLIEKYPEIKKYYVAFISLVSFDYEYLEYISIFDSDPIYIILNYIKLNDEKFYDIYIDLIQNKLFNPNKRLLKGNKNPFMSCQTKLSLEEEKIFLDQRCDYRLDSNGTNVIDTLIIAIRKEKDVNKQNKLKGLLFKAIKENNCSVLDSVNVEIDTSRNSDHIGIFENIFSSDKQKEIFLEIYEYLMTSDGIEKQINIAKYPSPYRNISIDLYIDSIKKENPNSDDLIKRLESLKV